MQASKFIAIAALATAFGGQAFAGSLSYNDGAANTQAQASVSTLTRAEVQSQTDAYVNGPRSLSYDVQVAPVAPAAQASIRSRDDVRAEAVQSGRTFALAQSVGA